MLKKILLNYSLGIGLALLLIPITQILISLLPDIGWHFLTIAYIVILSLQIAFYYFTTNFSFWWTTLNFIFNFIFIVFECVILDSYFHIYIIYFEDQKFLTIIFLGILWVTNKLLFDELLSLNKSIHQNISKIKI